MGTLRDEREREGVGVEIEPLTTQTDGKMTSLLLIVAWDRPDLWDLWRRWFAGVEEVQVVLDQRRGERRQRGNVHEPERRRVERRRQPGLEDELRSTGFAITRP